MNIKTYKKIIDYGKENLRLDADGIIVAGIGGIMLTLFFDFFCRERW